MPVNADTYSEDSPHSSGDRGSFILAVRNDLGTVLAGASGDYIPLTTDSSGALRVVNQAGSPVGSFNTFTRFATVNGTATGIAAPGLGLAIYIQQITVTNTVGGGNIVFGINGSGGPFFADANNTDTNAWQQLTFPGGLNLGNNNSFVVIAGNANMTVSVSYAVGPVVA